MSKPACARAPQKGGGAPVGVAWSWRSAGSPRATPRAAWVCCLQACWARKRASMGGVVVRSGWTDGGVRFAGVCRKRRRQRKQSQSAPDARSRLAFRDAPFSSRSHIACARRGERPRTDARNRGRHVRPGRRGGLGASSRSSVRCNAKLLFLRVLLARPSAPHIRAGVCALTGLTALPGDWTCCCKE